MTPSKPKPQVVPPARSFEDFQADLQKQTMSNVRLMLITLLANEPPVTEWPPMVRKYMYLQLMRAVNLFQPQVEGEYDDADNS